MLETHFKRPSLVQSSNTTMSLPFSISSMITGTTNSKPMKLPDDFVPRDIDILCGRGRGVFDHTGNRHFKQLIQAHANEYRDARTKIDKGVVVASLVDSIREQGILFVKKDAKTQSWYDIGEYQARDKTSHAIRDYMSKGSDKTNIKKSSKATTTKRRREQDEIKRNQQPSINGGSHAQTQQQDPSFLSQSVLCDNSCLFSQHPYSGVAPKRISGEILPKIGLDELSLGFDYDLLPDVCPSLVTERNQTTIPYDYEEIERRTSVFEEETLSMVLNDNEEGLQWSDLFPIGTFDDFVGQHQSCLFAT